MNMKISCVKTVSILLALEIILLTGCQSSPQSSASESSSSSTESEKVPEDLIGLESNIETTIKMLDGPAVQVKQQESGQETSSQPGSQSAQQGQQSSSSSTSQAGSQSAQQGQQSSSSSTSQTDPMEKISPIVEKMHYQWNNLMPEAVKKGAGKDLVNNFDNALNNLSKTVSSKNKMNTLLAANGLYAYIPDFYSLFDAKSSPEIKRVRYFARSAILSSLAANWAQADSDIGNLKSVWALYKGTLGKDQQDMANKLDLSIYELEKVVAQRNQQLTNIKGKVVLSNTEALEEAAGSEFGGQSGSG